MGESTCLTYGKPCQAIGDWHYWVALTHGYRKDTFVLTFSR